MKILAIDPGGTTGFSSNAVFQPDWQIKFENAHTFAVYLNDLIPKHDRVIYERFDHRKKNKIDHAAVEQIGIIVAIAEGHKVTIVAQGSDAKSRKGFWDDKKLKHIGLWKPYNDDHKHGQDALRHRLMYELNHGLTELTVFKSLP